MSKDLGHPTTAGVVMQPMDIVGQDRCSIEDLSSGPRPSQKYMSNRIADRVVYLERRMMGFAEALEQAHSISATNSLITPLSGTCCHFLLA